MTRCPTCGRILYEKKGYNKKSLMNLVSFGHNRKKFNTKRIITSKQKCVIENCINKRVGKSVLCLEHLAKRSAH